MKIYKCLIWKIVLCVPRSKLIQSSKVISVSFSSNGEYLAFGSLNSTIGVYRVSIGELIKPSQATLLQFEAQYFRLQESDQHQDLGIKPQKCGAYRVENESKLLQATLHKSEAQYFLQTKSIWHLDLETGLSVCGEYRAENISKP